MNWLSIEEIYDIHQAIIKRAGTKASVRDFTLLHSATERPRASYNGLHLYPTIFLKAAALLYSLCMNHPFTDGNKRTAYSSAHRFLWINGYHLSADTTEIIEFMINVDNQKPDTRQISSWLKSHSTKVYN